MKQNIAITIGCFFIGLMGNTMAQSGSPPGQAFINPAPVMSTSPPAASVSSTLSVKRMKVDEETLKGCCEKLENDKRRIYYLNTRNYRMSLQLKGIYIRDELLFFRLFLCNHSHLDYEVDSIRFYVTDNHWQKNTALQVKGLSPIYVYGNAQLIRGKSREFPVIVLPRFTLPSDKHLVIEVLEKNGGRHLALQAYNFTLLRPRLI